MPLQTKINFALQGSTIDLQAGLTPNYLRSTSLLAEYRREDGDLELQVVEAHRPALVPGSQSLYLEPGSLNEITWNDNLINPIWSKGENVVVQPDEDFAPQKTFAADRIIIGGDPGQDPERQIIRRTFELQPNTHYTLSLFLKLKSGNFGGNDLVRMVGGIKGAASINLSELNPYPEQYRILETSFTSQGSDAPDGSLASPLGERAEWEILGIDGDTLTLSVTSNFNYQDVLADDLVGSRISISGRGVFSILGNGYLSVSAGVFTVRVEDLPLTTALGDSCTILPAEKALVTLELYCESNVMFNWGLAQLEPLPFRSSPILQQENINSRTPITLVYRQSPIGGLADFGVYWEIDSWRGTVNLYDSDDFQVTLDGEGLHISWAGNSYSYNAIPQADLSLLIQVQEIAQELRAYLAGELVIRAPLPNPATASVTSPLSLTNDAGVLVLKKMLCFNQSLPDGEITLLQTAGAEVRELFAEDPITPSRILNHRSTVVLPQVTIPAASSAIQAPIIAVHKFNRTVQIAGGGFALQERVAIVRDDRIVGETAIDGINGDLIQLRQVENIERGDLLVKGPVPIPGQASVRFPFYPRDSQEILDIQGDQLTLRVVTAFNLGRAFIYNQLFQSLAEVKITDIDTGTQKLTVDSTDNYAIGNTIAQPSFETLISPSNYFVATQEVTSGVRVTRKTQNCLVLSNYNDREVSVTPYLKVYL